MSLSTPEDVRPTADVDRCLEALRRKGCRITPQRRRIVELLLDTPEDHPNAQELFSRIRAQDPTVGLATVYRTVELLAELGLIHRLRHDEGFARFGIAGDGAAIRLICRCCGQSTEAPDSVRDALEQWAQDQDFSLNPQVVVLTGICAACRSHPEASDVSRCSRCGCGRRHQGCPRHQHP